MQMVIPFWPIVFECLRTINILGKKMIDNLDHYNIKMRIPVIVSLSIKFLIEYFERMMLLQTMNELSGYYVDSKEKNNNFSTIGIEKKLSFL